MTSPAPLRPTATYQQAQHPVTPPPQDSTLVRNVALVLASGLAISAMAEGIELLLAPYGITARSIMAAIGLARTTHNPRARLARHGVDKRSEAAQIPRAAAKAERYFRAAYVINASRRIEQSVADGATLGEALNKELPYFTAHEAARDERLGAAAKVGIAAQLHGPLLGWYLDPLLNNDPECIAADGHNFYADEGTVIGLPGMVHRFCGCEAGPPHEGATLVNEALRGVIRRVPSGQVNEQVFKLKRVPQRRAS